MNVKHGFSTLNRLLGKKNKGHNLSKSSTNLSTISSHIDTSVPLSSHLDQNRITPLPIATSNAPFEQTFRITVLLPRDQLYVARMGAKTKLEKLLELVCENKQLDPEKYEFRHPIDTSQVFSCELTIGAVGLSEIRLCHKSEAYDNFNADEIIKLRHTGRDSLSSSEFSSRNSKHTLKTASPYSSTNSLNSIDSTGMSTNYRGPVLSLPPPHHGVHRTTSSGHHPPVAPARKKRVAPRPPSQNSIPEREAIPVNGYKENQSEFKQPLPVKDFHVSSPNLSQYTELTTLRSADFHQSNISVDCNGNNNNSRNNNSNHVNGLSRPNGHIHCNGNLDNNLSQKIIQKSRPVSMSALNGDISSIHTSDNDLSSKSSCNDGSIPNLSNGSTETVKVPEPIPRKRVVTAKKKAPAPPPRTLAPPIAQPRVTASAAIPEVKAKVEEAEPKETNKESKESESISINGDHSTTDNLYSKLAAKEEPIKTENDQSQNQPLTINNDKIQIPATKDVEKAKESTATNVKKSQVSIITTIEKAQVLTSNIDNVAEIKSPSSEEKHVINTTGSPLATTNNPLSDKHKLEPKTSLESSSDEEASQINVYNLKLGKTIVKQVAEQKVVEDSSTISSSNIETRHTDDLVVGDNTSLLSDSSGWTYTIPAPPNFADTPMASPITKDAVKQISEISIVGNTKPKQYSITELNKTSHLVTDPVISASNKPPELTEIPDSPITPIIKERAPVDFQILTETTTPLDQTETSEPVITSDIEDGYRGGKDKKETKNNQTILNEEKKKAETEAVSKSNVETSLKSQDGEIVNDFTNFKSTSPLNSLESFDSTKTDVLCELNNVINDNKIENVIRKVEDTEDIKSVKPCALSNFKIQTYNPVTGPIKTFVESNISPEENKPKETHEEPINIQKETEGTYKTQRQTSEDEKLYKKRSSITLSNNVASQLFRSRVSINRSDSFHSTRYLNSLETEEPLTSRSSSYVSLMNAQKLDQKPDFNQQLSNANRRKSASELSIGESPSLQSLIVMKSILNSRKNSLNNENDLQKSSVTNQNGCVDSKFYEDNDIKSPRVETVCDCDSSKENSPKNKILSQQITSVERTEKKDDSERKWKYQGPPSINLSTWSERPKVQVSIKDDSDYKFGVGCGGTALNTPVSTLPRNCRNSISSCNAQIEISTNTKPLSSVRIVSEQPKVPFVRSVEYKKSTSLVQNESDTSKIGSDSNSPLFPKPLSAGNTMTLGRMPKINRTSFVPTVKGFKSVENAEEYPKFRKEVNGHHQNGPQVNINTWKSTTKIERSNSAVSDRQSAPNVVLNTWKNTSKGIERNNSRTSINVTPVDKSILKPSTQNNIQAEKKGLDKEKQEHSCPFGQVVLRKTGLKEKILSSNEPETPKPLPGKCVEPQNCTKLELKLTTVNPAAKTTIKKSPESLQTAEEKQQPPPPPPPIIRSVVTKQNPGIRTSYHADPRDQLLYAIRSFNKDTLKRA